MQIVRSRIQYFLPAVFILLLTWVWVLSFREIATAGYADSAHGDSSIGVKRSGTECPTGTPCPRGDCTHCHDTFESTICGVNELMLFEPLNDENFCYQCHRSTSSVQEGGITNYMYSKTFGGESADHGITSVYDACNASGSSHDPATVLNWVVTTKPQWGFTSESNPCTICHPSHIARANKRSPKDPTKTAIRRPSEHATNPGNLWGDDSNETMKSNWSTTDQPYQAPWYMSGASYEPGGTTSTDGSKHPDYATFCLDCHSQSVNGLTAIEWTRTTTYNAPYHGKKKFWSGLKWPTVPSPYTQFENYVLSCLDCHEPMGSPNIYLLRSEVNNVSGLQFNDIQSQIDWNNFCRTCHNWSGQHGGADCWQSQCHPHGADYSI